MRRLTGTHVARSACAIALIALCTACAPTTTIVETNPSNGDVALIRDNVCVQAASLGQAKTVAGGKVGLVCIGGKVVMGVPHFEKLHEESIVLDVYARECYRNAACDASARRAVDEALP